MKIKFDLLTKKTLIVEKLDERKLCIIIEHNFDRSEYWIEAPLGHFMPDLQNKQN